MKLTFFNNLFLSANSPNRIIRVSNVHLSADPVHIPGPETFSGDLEILKPVTGHIRLDVVIEKHFLFGWPDIPCITAGGQKIGTWFVLYIAAILYALTYLFIQFYKFVSCLLSPTINCTPISMNIVGTISRTTFFFFFFFFCK